jgi:uncharacterized protein DUF1569
MDGYLRSALDAIDDAVDDIPSDVITRKDGERWSIAEILEHLTLVFTNNNAALEKALASGELRARKPVLKQTLGRFLVVGCGYFPRVEAPETSRPSGRIPPTNALAAVRDALRLLDSTMSRAAEKFGADMPAVNHPYFAGMSIAQWRKFHWRHTVHHMKQVRERVPR